MIRSVKTTVICVAILLWGSGGNSIAAIATTPNPDREIANSALAAGYVGLFATTDFRLVRGDCPDCDTIKQALWYFRDDLVAVPNPGVAIAGASRGIPPQEDIKRWIASASRDDLSARPPLVWVGSPSIVVDARLQPQEERLQLKDGTSAQFRLTPKIPSNRS